MRKLSGGARKAVQVVLATGVAAGAMTAEATVDSWLRIPGIPGESTNADHKGEIVVLSYAQTLDNKNCAFAVEKLLDSASPAFAEAAAKKTTLPSVVFSARLAGEGQKDFYTVTLASATIANLNTSYASGAATAREEVTFSPRSVTVTYRPQDAKGSLGAAITTSFTCDK